VASTERIVGGSFAAVNYWLEFYCEYDGKKKDRKVGEIQGRPG
jgi:hypothetical protein